MNIDKKHFYYSKKYYGNIKPFNQINKHKAKYIITACIPTLL